MGHKIRRQVPIGGLIADFVCERARVIIEVDGGQHQERVAKDEARTRELEAHGYRVIRFWNHEVLGNMAGVLEVVTKELAA